MKKEHVRCVRSLAKRRPDAVKNVGTAENTDGADAADEKVRVSFRQATLVAQAGIQKRF